MTGVRRLVGVGSLLLLALWAPTAAAEPSVRSADMPTSEGAAPEDTPDPGQAAEEEEAERPWAKGVAQAKQRKAADLFNEGNKRLDDGLFAQAISLYNEALSHWNHPAIHYNAALAVIQLDKPITAHEHLVEAMRYGAAPLDQEKYVNAQRLLVLVKGRLAKVVVTCDEKDAEVRLDGSLLFRAPGRYEGLVLQGEHTVTATKPGFQDRHYTLSFASTRDNEVPIQLYREDELKPRKRRWALWGPVTLTSTGIVLLGTAPLLSLQAKDRYEDYDDVISTREDCLTGCKPDDNLADLKKRGERLDTAAAVMYAAGGTAVATGIVLMVVNRKIEQPMTPEEADKRRGITVAPSIGPSAFGISGSARF